jgi:putative transposase
MKMCKVMDVNRSSYYSWLNRKPSINSIKNSEILEEIKSIHKLSKGVYGSPTIKAVLKEKGIKCSRPRVARLMRKNSICSIVKRKHKITTNSKHTHNISPNLLKTVSKATVINEQWAADISYLRTNEGWLYLSVIMDLYSRKIISWTTSTSLSKEIVTKVLWSAIKTRNKNNNKKNYFSFR